MADISRRVALVGTIVAAASAATPAAASSGGIVGTWTLVSVYRELEDGSKVVNVMGDNPKGIFFFDAQGRFSHQLIRADGARFDCGPASQDVSEENRAAAIGASSYFGTYQLAPTGDSIVFNIEASLLARQIGAKQKRFIKVMADTMEYWTPKIPSAQGAFVRKLVWRRA